MNKNKDYIKIIVCCLGFFILISIFNSIADIYSMGTLHRSICILSISFTHIFFTPLFDLFNKNLKNNQKN